MSYPIVTLNAPFASDDYVNTLESGNILFFPDITFREKPSEREFFSENILGPKQKNISFDINKHKLQGTSKSMTYKEINLLAEFMHRFALFSHNLVSRFLTPYIEHLNWGRTSFRPAQIKGRVTSKRKDDTRLHVDAFPATPVHDKRILRLFCNVHSCEPRTWHVGEPYNEVLEKFAAKLPKYNPIKASLLKLIGATKSKRSAYDHYMLNLHDLMKLDDDYQQTVKKYPFDFPALSTWIVFTDHVSHAALSGQFLLEQTFYLPVKNMANPCLSPFENLKALKKF